MQLRQVLGLAEQLRQVLGLAEQLRQVLGLADVVGQCSLWLAFDPKLSLQDMSASCF